MTSDFKWDAQGRPVKPGIIGLGAQKSGTSWLSKMLAQHGRVWVPPVQEVHFFNYRFIEKHRYWIKWHYRQTPVDIMNDYALRKEVMPPEVEDYLRVICASNRMYSNHWYKRIFAPAPQGVSGMDMTPEYSALPEEAIAFMLKFLPKARFIYLVRDPVDRAVSQMRMNLMREKRLPADRKAWLAEADAPVLLARGDYASYIPRWQKYAGKKLLVLPYGTIRRDPLSVMRRIEDFLELDEWQYKGLDQRVFATPDRIQVPDYVRDALKERFSDQYQYLEAAFGTDFLRAIT